jgi:hypothetical protein
MLKNLYHKRARKNYPHLGGLMRERIGCVSLGIRAASETRKLIFAHLPSMWYGYSYPRLYD